MNSDLVWNRGLKKGNGGSPRIHAGELGFSSRAAPVELFSSGFSRGGVITAAKGRPKESA
jgi:hypothetical protein